MAGRFWSEKDVNAIDQFNKELVEDVVSTTCTLYSVSVKDTETNIYGEAKGGGKNYKKPVEIPCLISHVGLSLYLLTSVNHRLKPDPFLKLLQHC